MISSKSPPAASAGPTSPPSSPHQPMKPPNTNTSSPLLPNPNPNPNPNRPSSSSSACAACKYQRRKCNPDCLLAPYFPAVKHRQFLNAHRLFGVSNMQKILRGIDPRLHGETIKSIIYQSDARAADPVGGCLRQILDLQHQIQITGATLFLTNQRLDIFRAQAAASLQQNNSSMFPQDVNLVTSSGGETAVYGFGLPQQDQQYYSNELNSFGPQQKDQQYYSKLNSFGVNVDDHVSNNVLSFQEEIEDDDIKLIGKGKETMSMENVASTSARHCSSKTGKLQTNDTQHVEEHDLKNAAPNSAGSCGQ